MSDPEQHLAYAVLCRAVTDAQYTADRPDLVRAREDARRFILDIEGRWARTRAFWCDMAGMDPAVFRRAVERMLA